MSNKKAEGNRCPSCGAIIDASKPGKYKCAYCDSEYFVSKNGNVSNIKEEPAKTKKNHSLVIVIIVICLAVFAGILFYSLSSTQSKEEVSETKEVIYSSYKDAQVGDYVLFGNYEQDDDTSNGAEQIEWLVLSRTEDGLLLISRYGLDSKKYNDVAGFTDWDSCSLRKWLNSDFYNTAFSDENKKYIITTNNTIEYASSEVSKDKVFLLSAEEADHYFADDDARAAIATQYAVSNGVDAYDSGACWWWLRTVCEDNEYAMNVRSRGNLRYAAEIAVNSDGYAVRPCIWLSYDEVKDTASSSKVVSSSTESKSSNNLTSSSFTITILDEKMGVYDSTSNDRQWVKAIYAGEEYECIDVYVDNDYTWYCIGKDMWIKDPDGTRVKTPNSDSVKLTFTDQIDRYWYKVGDDEWIYLEKDYVQNNDSKTIIIPKSEYITYHLTSGGANFYRTEGDKLIIYGEDNDSVVTGQMPQNFKNSITEVEICNEIIGIRNDTFDSWNIKKAIIHNGIIYNYAFKDCNNLEEIVILSDDYIHDDAFEGCNNIKKIYYFGSEEEMNNIISRVKEFQKEDIEITCNFISSNNVY